MQLQRSNTYNFNFPIKGVGEQSFILKDQNKEKLIFLLHSLVNA
jgi:hypothetical protein